MNVKEALNDLRAIRSQLVRSEQVTCYRWATIGFSGVVGVMAAFFQPLFLSNSSRIATDFVGYWMLIATLNMSVIGIEMVSRYAKSSDHARQQTRLAVLDFAPCLIFGVFLTQTLIYQLPEHCSLVPGLWALLFGLGVAASRRRIPGSLIWVSAWYLLAGLSALKYGEPFAAWKMGIAFGGGQLLTAGLLYPHQKGHHA